jgi:signal transduction histidine kinase
MPDKETVKTKVPRNVRYWLIIFLCATFIGFVYGGRSVFVLTSAGRPIDWPRQVGFEFLYWYVWAALTPLVIWIARHFDVERSNWPRTLSALIGFGLLIAPLQGAIETGIALLIEWRILHATAAELARRRQLMARLILIETFGNFIIYFLIVGGVYAYDYYQKYREREMRSLDLEGRLAQAELQNLKMQLHPHFLFNTLHTISVLMMRNVEAANQMLIRLSDLLRITLDSIGTEEVSLKQELDFLRGYLEIEQTRFQDRLTVKMDVDPATLDARVPNLILQPLVENAIRHGIASRPDEGLIVIRATLMDKTLCLQVRDNGPGLSSEDLASLNQGVGLTNTQARLRQLYGSSHRFEISTASEGGLAVTVNLPFHINEDRD